VDQLFKAAKEYAKLFDKDYIYTLETGAMLQVYFIPSFFHHLVGLQKLTDIPPVKKGPGNSPNYIFRNIFNGTITMDDIQKSKHFNEIENRLRHFSQINRLIEFEKIIIDFEPSLIKTKLDADYVLFKKSNDNMYLNLFLKDDDGSPSKQIPLTFLTEITDYYTYGQKVIKILSMTEVARNINQNK